ncbi:hypothetical protein M9194_09870 [Vibrio sp. S4M6]|uniref:hypothetical protein n=1 Tax=Vibrio sinus TaxID=2946865 RepID=UPI00202A5124|nr:hypothetical protein [Vibrio sinus]MCL9781732.1 hypothetical protein [Vibrio sinus]
MKLIPLLLFSIPFFANAQDAPYCNPEHLQIRHLALVTPGMSQTDDIYGVFNTSNHACLMLNQAVHVSPIVEGNNKVVMRQNPQPTIPKKRDYYLLPSAKGNTQLLESLVWFKVHGAGACDSRVQINELMVTLSPSDKQQYTLPFSGYSSCGVAHSVPLRQGAKGWPSYCQYDGKTQSEQRASKTILIDQTASCG